MSKFDYWYVYLINTDSHEFLGDDEGASSQSEGTTAATTATSESQESDPEESMETETASETTADKRDVNNKENGEEKMESTDAAATGEGKEDEGGKEGEKKIKPEEEEYNPLIVRRSQRAIKPTKDVDLYLLGAQYGIDVEGSDADSSDQEFAPAVESDRKFLHILKPCFALFPLFASNGRKLFI